MQNPTPDLIETKPNVQNQDSLSESMQEQCNRHGRRNALTPEAHHIEPIRQTEIQEKMSNLTVAGSSSSGSSGDGDGGSCSSSDQSGS